MKKRAYRYQGQFYKEKMALDQLSVDLYRGTGEIHDLHTVNKQLKNYNVPLEISHGYIGGINISIPWASLLTGKTRVEIKNLEVTIHPHRHPDTPMQMSCLNLC